jgi:hypothetical protein
MNARGSPPQISPEESVLFSPLKRPSVFELLVVVLVFESGRAELMERRLKHLGYNL